MAFGKVAKIVLESHNHLIHYFLKIIVRRKLFLKALVLKLRTKNVINFNGNLFRV